MATLEMVEKLRERADVTFEEAREALDASNNDLLDAMILLERQGKVNPTSGGEYSGSDSRRRAKEAEDEWKKAKEEFEKEKATNKERFKAESHKFKQGMSSLGRFLLRAIEIGNNNFVDAIHRGRVVFSCPVTVLVVLLIFFFWAVVPLMILGLFFNWRYRFRGENFGREQVNDIMAKAEAAADEVKNSFKERAETVRRDESGSAAETSGETDGETN